jgi:hypothetical protein
MDLNRLVVQSHCSRICPVKTVQDFHQRALPGPVFSQQGMDFPLINIQIDLIVGQTSGNRLVTPRKLSSWRLVDSIAGSGLVYGSTNAARPITVLSSSILAIAQVKIGLGPRYKR